MKQISFLVENNYTLSKDKGKGHSLCDDILYEYILGSIKAL
jgi:hypothetical protein